MNKQPPTTQAVKGGKMKVKKIKQLLSRLYYEGICDGRDIGRIPEDRFFGNMEARGKWEKDILLKAYKDIKELFSPTNKGEE